MRTLTIAMAVALLVAACEESDLSASRGAGGGKGTNGAGDGLPGEGEGDPTQPGSCQEGAPHVGFANANLVGDRVIGGIGANRRRVKPFSAYKSEFERSLGAAPAGLAGSAAAFGEMPARWYGEPTAGAVSLYTTYTLAFTGCYDTMTDAKYAQMPTADSASIECAALQKKIWQRSPSPEETKVCADHALGLTEETVARRRWAHACASVMASAGFTTY